MAVHCYHFVRFLFAAFSYVTSGRRCRFLLLDTPEHGNLGDQAIALAEKQLLREWFGEDSFFEITASQIDGFEKVLSKFTPTSQIILIHGGGFLGSLWPAEEYRFRRILAAFPAQKIVVFPQTVTFDESTDEGKLFLQGSIESWCAHPSLTIFCRERKSLQQIRKNFLGVEAFLVPDIVLGLEAPKFKTEREGVLFCMRADHERDLKDSVVRELYAAIEYALPNAPISYTDTVINHRVSPDYCQKMVFSKLEEFSAARLIITDRLHGMIFAAITGTPCIALNNSNGKVGRVYEWLTDLPYVHFFKNSSDAVGAIRNNAFDPGEYPLRLYRDNLDCIRLFLSGCR